MQLKVESRKGDFVSTKKFWKRKKSRAKRGSLCEPRKSRKIVTCHGLRVVEPVYHQASLRGRLRSWRRASRQGQRCSCLFFKTHQTGLQMCFSAKPQTSREVDQDPEGALTRQCITRSSFLIMCCVWESLSQDDRGGLRHRARSSPTPASLVKTHSRHTSKCRFSSRVTAIQNGSM